MRGTKLSGENGFLQFMITRLLASDAPSETAAADPDDIDDADDMKLTSIQSITDYINCAGSTLPDNIRLWARRNLAVAKSSEVTPEERRHAQRALSIMLNIQWKDTDFEPIDPVMAKKILDEELYGLDSVKQRIIETIIQINRTHTLPAYGILLIGPAGTGKTQLAYAVARILRMSWCTLEMSSINDPEQLTGSARIYANAKPGLIMEAFSNAESSNLLFIINELDKASAGNTTTTDTLTNDNLTPRIGEGYYVFNATAGAQYEFVGWCILRENYQQNADKNHPISHAEIAKGGDIFVARFVKTAHGSFTINHKLHPQSSGFGDVYVQATVKNSGDTLYTIGSVEPIRKRV